MALVVNISTETMPIPKTKVRKALTKSDIFSAETGNPSTPNTHTIKSPGSNRNKSFGCNDDPTYDEHRTAAATKAKYFQSLILAFVGGIALKNIAKLTMTTMHENNVGETGITGGTTPEIRKRINVRLGKISAIGIIVESANEILIGSAFCICPITQNNTQYVKPQTQDAKTKQPIAVNATAALNSSSERSVA
ncbi:hypothetical protein [Corynebacterium freiburgense]|uniref:hypothetical protein n=1 Tax=Corynebacterium freiburgense TaxID=556548 RepID=UPI0012EBA340|nr:hypothetical protein [Corynebacterium freiburgense]